MEKEELFSLVQKASNGDMEAFKLVLEESSRRILYNSYDIMKNHHDAEDAAQDVVIKMYQHISGLQKPENFNAWMHKIIHNVCISKLRKSNHYKNDLELDEIMDPAYTDVLMEKDREFLPQAFAEDKDLSETLIKTIRALPKRRRRAIMLYYYEDLSQKEIATVMGISESTVASNILRAKEDIKKKLQRETGIDIDSALKESKDKSHGSVAGKMAAIPVLSEVLRADAVTQFGPESIAGLVNTDFSNIPDVTPKSGGSGSGIALGAKAVAIVTAAGIVCGGVFVAADPLSEKNVAEVDSSPSATTEQAVGTSITEDGQIDFLGGDCDCGHENPVSAILSYEESDDSEGLNYSWELVNSQGGVISNGEGRAITIPEDGIANGTYTARFILTDPSGNVLKVEREFEIK